MIDKMNQLKLKSRIIFICILTLVGFQILLFSTSTSVLASHTPQHAAELACKGIQSAGEGDASCDETTSKNSINSTVKNVINILLYAVGIAAVIMLIIGAIKYVVSGGDQTAVASAKNTIIYAIVGIVVAIMAFAIVNLVISRTTTVTRADNLEVTSRARV